MKIADILKSKEKRAVMTVSPSETIAGLARRLRMAGVGAMIVSRDGTTIEGIISERDIAYALPDHLHELHTFPVSKLMTERVITCTPDNTIAEVAKTMLVQRVRHIPVLEGGSLVGVVSIGDVLKHRLSEIELEANVLRDLAVAGR